MEPIDTMLDMFDDILARLSRARSKDEREAIMMLQVEDFRIMLGKVDSARALLMECGTPR